MVRRNVKAATLSILGALVLLIAACAPAATPTLTPTPTPGVATPTPTPGVATPTPTPGVATPTPTPTPVVELQPQYGGTFYWDLGTASSFDTHRSVSVVVSGTPGNIFSALVRFDPDVDMEYYDPKYIVGDLAERWETSADGKLYTFYLRQGVTFHDGKPFTAKDVKHSLDKLTDPKRSVLYLEFAVIDRVEIVDDYTVKVYLKNPSGLFLSSLAQGMAVMQPEHLKDVSYRTSAFAIGTNAFKLKSFTSGVEAVFVKNPDYYIKGRPYFDEVHHISFAAAGFAAGVNAFMGRRLDMGFGVGASPGEEDVALVKRLAPDAVFVWHGGYPVFRGLTFNFEREGPWQDARVRKALVLTTDFPGSCLAAYGNLPQMCDAKTGYLFSAPRGVGLPWSEYEKAWWTNRPLEERVREAKRLMAEAGYPNGFKGAFLSRGTAANPGQYGLPALLMQDLWKRHLNVDLTIEMPESAVEDQKRTTGVFDMVMTFWVATIGDPEQLFVSAYVKGGSTNFGKYYHPQVEELYQQVSRETDFNKRIALTHQAERLLIDDIPNIPFYRSGKGLVFWPYLKGFKWHPFHTFLYNTQMNLWFDKNDPSWAKRAVGR